MSKPIILKKQLLILILFSLPHFAGACDICGCGVGGNYIGIMPEFNKQIIGLRYRQNDLMTHVGINGVQTYLTSREVYRTAELWGGWNISHRFRLMGSIPYNFNERHSQSMSGKKNGIGDVSALAFYQLLNSRRTVSDSKLLVQSLWIGGGVKLATGAYNPADKAQNTQNANLFQLGSGSTDFAINAMYDARLQDAGINTTVSYKVNTTNKYDYRYGNKLTVSVQPYYKFNIGKKMTIAPNAGVLLETAQQDADNHFSVDASGGYLLLGTIGTEVSLKKISLGANIQTPLSQDLALGIVKAKNRGMVHIALAL